MHTYFLIDSAEQYDIV